MDRASPFGRHWSGRGSAPRRVTADGSLGVAAPRAIPGLHRFSHEAMATVFEVFTTHGDAKYAAQAAQAAFALTDALEAELTRFLPNSDISRINALPAGGATQVSPSTLECLLIARHVYEVSGGAFDISIGTGLPSVVLDTETFRVEVRQQGVRLDLGGIGKGYAVDRMAEVLEEWGLGPALVHGGFSSVLALDAPEGEDGWPMTLSDPDVPGRVLARFSARQVAFSASGVRKGDHIVHPATGRAVRSRRGAWIAVPRSAGGDEQGGEDAEPGEPGRPAAGTVADALTTAFMLMSHRDIASLCARTPGLEAWVLRRPGRSRGDGAAELVHFGGIPG
jgi:thiamine biosynthesis lipoprotein